MLKKLKEFEGEKTRLKSEVLEKDKTIAELQAQHHNCPMETVTRPPEDVGEVRNDPSAYVQVGNKTHEAG